MERQFADCICHAGCCRRCGRSRECGARVSGLRVDQPVDVARGPAGLGSRTVEYVVTLSSPSLSKAYKTAGKLSKAAQKAHLATLKGEQDKVAAARVRQLGGKELARVSKALNGLVVTTGRAQET